MKKFSFLLVLAFMCQFSMAQSKYSASLRAFLLQKEYAIQSNISADNDELDARIKQVGSQEYISVFLHFTSPVEEDWNADLGVRIRSLFNENRIATADVPISSLEALSEMPEIDFIEMPEPVHITMDKARAASHINEMHTATAPLTQAYKGKGVIFAAVDRGMQYNHINFYSPEGKFRMKRVWNQTGGGTYPAGYNYGAEYADSAAIVNAKFDDSRDPIGHACHVTGIAAGSYMADPHYGIATESDIAFVSMGYYESSVADGVKYLMDYATQEAKPIVVNLSLGTHMGPHDGSSTFDKLCDGLVGPGKIIVGSCGNEGGDKFHLFKDFANDASDLKSFFLFRGEKNGKIDIWANAPDKDFTVQLITYNKETGKIDYQSEVFNGLTTKNKWVRSVPDKGFNGYCSLVSGKSPLNNCGHVRMDVRISSLASTHFVGLLIKKVDNVGVNAWTDDLSLQLNAFGKAGYTTGDYNSSNGEIGGTGKHIITVGSYTSRGSAYAKEGDISAFSSWGPTADGRLKPEIVAPGEVIISSVPNISSVTNGRIKMSHTVEVGGETYQYAYMQGTSMSSPFVAGTIACWLEADPTLTYDKINEVFRATADEEGLHPRPLPSNKWGAGKINGFRGLQYVLGETTAIQDASLPTAMVVYPNPTSDSFNVTFTRDDSNVSLFIYTVNGQLVKQVSIGTISTGYNQSIPVDYLSTGLYMIQIKGDSTHETVRLIKE